ncbi:hypothetical protein ACHAWO_013062, partial [Cyclotella atomus]
MSAVSFKQWLAALQSTTCTSPEYISAALQIAAALTEQIVTSELHANDQDPNGEFECSLPLPFPISRIDWSSFMTVYLHNVQVVNEGLRESLRGEASRQSSPLEPLLLDAPYDSDDGGLLGLIAEDLERLSNNYEELYDEDLKIEDVHNAGAAAGVADEDDVGEGSEDAHLSNYLNVASAKLFSDNTGSQAQVSRERIQRIYSLGLVLYQLFSGGRLPPSELLVVSSPNGEFIKSVDAYASNQEGAAGEELEPGDEYDLAAWRSQCPSVNTTHSDEHDLAAGKSRCSSVDALAAGGSRCSSVNAYDSGANDVARQLSQGSGESSAKCLGSVKRRVDDSPLGNMPGYSRESSYDDSHCSSLQGVKKQSTSSRLMKQSIASSRILHCEEPINLLRLQGVPAPICDLIYNMVDMYLDPLDTDKLLLTGLKLDDTLFVRDYEFSTLRHAYEQSMTGSSELAIISGVSGTGKTTMNYNLGNLVIANGGTFLSGKFNQMRIQSFSAIVSAFESFCSRLLSDDSASIIIVSKLRAALGSDMHFLVQMIPNLRLILNDDASCEPIGNHDCVLSFVSVRRGDLSRQDGKLFFLASCRDDEMPSDHPFWTMIQSIGSFGFTTTEVKLRCMSKDTVNNVVSNLLHLSPRLVASLSDIVYHKTKGNPLFVSRMLRSLNREGLLRVSLTRHRWEWDEEKIQARKIPDDVASFFVDSISTLPVDVRLALCTLSCFGNSAHYEVLSAIESDLNLNLTESLNDAIAEGFLDKLGNKYYFCHDRIQEAAYSMIDEQHRCIHHMNYGLSLVNHTVSTEDDSFLFTAVAQLNLAGPKAVQDKQQYTVIAKHNLVAGKKAMEMSEFSSAFNYFDNGISFLRKRHWQEEHALSLELYNLA